MNRSSPAAVRPFVVTFTCIIIISYCRPGTELERIDLKLPDYDINIIIIIGVRGVEQGDQVKVLGVVGSLEAASWLSGCLL